MATARVNPVVRLLPSLTDVAFLMPIVFLFARMQGVKTMLGDGDTGWHIRTGEWILANGTVPHQDVFSYTKAGQPWFAWEWLWDMCFAWLYHHGGLATVVTVNIALLCLTFALLFRLVRSHCENPFLAIGVTFLACAASALHWLARPHLVTLLFVVILLFILDRVRQGHARLLLALPLMFVLWTNLHGGFFVGLIVLGGYTAGEVLRALFTRDIQERRTALKLTRQLALTAGGCALATLLNPYTYHLHLHIYQFFSEPYHVQNIAEYQSISFHEAPAVYLEFLLLLGVVSAVWFVMKRRDYVPLVLIAGWGHLALFAARNIPLFAIIAAPFIAEAFQELLRSLQQAPTAAWIRKAAAALLSTGSEFGETDRHWRLYPLSLAVTAVLAVLISNPNAVGKLKPEYDPQKYPAKALSVLRSDPNSHIFTDDEWGDYLLYNLYPGHKVFVDGRDDFYGQDFEQKYLDVMMVKYDWEQFLAQYRVDTIVLSTKSALASAIKQSCHWRPVYDDTVAIVFKAVRKPAAPVQPVPTNVVSGGQDRGPRITNAGHRDPRIAESKPTKGV